MNSPFVYKIRSIQQTILFILLLYFFMRVNAQTEGWRPLYVNPSPLRSLGRRGVVIAIVPPFVRSVVDGHRLVGPEPKRKKERTEERGGVARSSVLVVRRRPLTLAMEASLREKDGQRTREGARERQNGLGGPLLFLKSGQSPPFSTQLRFVAPFAFVLLHILRNY